MTTSATTPRRLRVAFVTSLILGGSERQMMELAKRLPRDRFEVTFVVMGERGPHAEIVESYGVRVMALGASRQRGAAFPLFALRVSGKVLRYAWWCRRQRFDIVDAWLYHGYGLAGVMKPFAGVPILISGRRSLSDFKAGFGVLQRLVDRIARAASDAIVANSRYVVDDVVRRERIDPANLRVIRNGVEIPAPMSAERRAELRATWGVEAHHVVIGLVANNRAGKGLPELVESAAALRTRVPDARYVLVGDGLDRLVDLVAGLGVGDIVTLHGQELDARTLYGAFDVVAQTSRAEGLPNAVLEGAAAGRAIVATAAGGTPEIVLDDVTGLLVPVADPAAFEAAVERLVRDPALRDRLGAAARAYVQETFGMDRFVAETAALYEELAEAKGLRRG
jgi:glycosyltransferase involved in cell wall biosynthesis